MSRCKCVLCGQLISDKDFTTAVPYKGRKAHLSCFNTAMKTLKKENDSLLEEKAKEAKKRSNSPKPKVELKGAMSEEEYAEKKAYYDYLKQLVVGDLQSKTYALTESYIAKYGFTWQGLYNTLVYLNEINSIPGSLAFYLWKEVGIDFTEECDILIDNALKMYREKKKMIRSFDTNILSNYKEG